MWVRAFYTLDTSGLPLPGGTSVNEKIHPNQSGTDVIIPNTPTFGGAIVLEAVVTRRFLRVNDDIYYYDDDDTAGYIGMATKIDGNPGLKLLRAAGTWNFAQPLQFDWTIRNTGTAWPVPITVHNAIGLIQAPLNLRTI